MRRALLLLAALAALALPAASASAAGEWRSEQPTASGLGVPTSIGEIGDIEFWAPNRGLLITAGNLGVPAGLFAYDGTGWHRYSTVCGGHEGRIAWAGPDEFWTISDQQTRQENGLEAAQHISLCHFVNGAVVTSYAEPLGLAESYLPLDAAACNGPADCWFGGERLPGTVNVGAFHLHWDGSNLAAVPSLTAVQPEVSDPGRAVTGLAVHDGAFFESVAVAPGDIAPQESEEDPSLLHQIFAGGGLTAFVPLFTPEPIADAAELEGPHLSADGEELWAVAGAAFESSASPTALRLGDGGFEVLELEEEAPTFAAGDRVGGVAAEPGGAAAWVGFRRPGDIFSSPTRLAKIHADGRVDPPQLLSVPSEQSPAGQNKGPAGPVACPGPGQCWVAAGGETQGWLFHLGPDLPQDTDPAMHALVTFRPPDASLPTVPPVDLPEDNSGAEAEEKKKNPELETLEEPLPKRAPALYSKVKSKLLAGNVLELSFVLRKKAHVQLFAKREGKVVAKTPRYTFEKGKRSVRVKLDPERWPTKLDLRVKEVKVKKGKAS